MITRRQTNNRDLLAKYSVDFTKDRYNPVRAKRLAACYRSVSLKIYDKRHHLFM